MIELVVLSPEAEILRTGAEQVELPGAAGRFVILKNHAPIISGLVAGDIRYRADGQDHALRIASGFVKVSDNVVTACVEL